MASQAGPVSLLHLPWCPFRSTRRPHGTGRGGRRPLAVGRVGARLRLWGVRAGCPVSPLPTRRAPTRWPKAAPGLRWWEGHRGVRWGPTSQLGLQAGARRAPPTAHRPGPSVVAAGWRLTACGTAGPSSLGVLTPTGLSGSPCPTPKGIGGLCWARLCRSEPLAPPAVRTWLGCCPCGRGGSAGSPGACRSSGRCRGTAARSPPGRRRCTEGAVRPPPAGPQPLGPAARRPSALLPGTRRLPLHCRGLAPPPSLAVLG